MSGPVLLTEAEWRARFAGLPLDRIMPVLEAQGLIAPEPDAIDRMCDALAGIHGIHLDREKMQRVFSHAHVDIGRAELTRERVREAYKWTLKAHPALQVTFTSDAFVDRFHAALTGQQEQDNGAL